MLVYVATYPRSGSAILRDTVLLNWHRATSNFYATATWPEEITLLPSTLPSASPELTSYRHKDGPVRQMLASPGRRLLTRSMRERLADSPEHFFIKTHEPPPADPVEGEVAIQLVRHPAAAIISQWKLHAATHDACPPLPHFWEGSDTGGRWDRYHLAWGAAGMPLFRRRFEDFLHAPMDLVPALADFLKLPHPERPIMMTAEEAKARNPIRNPIRGADGWMAQISVAELVQLWNRHKMVAKEMGYGMMGVMSPFTPPPQLIYGKKRALPVSPVGSEVMDLPPREDRVVAKPVATPAVF